MKENNKNKRFIEIMNKVNKIKLNENEMFGSDEIINKKFNDLLTDRLNIENTVIKTENEVSYLQLDCIDNENNSIVFRFEVSVISDEVDDVYKIGESKLIGFEYKELNLDEPSLENFNNINKDKISEIVANYVDIEKEEPSLDEEYGEIIDNDNSLNVNLGNDNINPDVEILKQFNALDDKTKRYMLNIGRTKAIEDFDQKGINKNNISEKDYFKIVKLKALEAFKNYLTSLNEENDKKEIDLDKLDKKKKKQGEVLKGGKGDGKSLKEFDPEQIKLGLKVEMEHTDDPLLAIEIVLDHLSEDNTYYTVKDNPEDSAQANASKEANDKKENKDEMINFKPLNVGGVIENY